MNCYSIVIKLALTSNILPRVLRRITLRKTHISHPIMNVVNEYQESFHIRHSSHYSFDKLM